MRQNLSNSEKGILLALLAASLYALNSPFSKLLLSSIPPTLMAGFLYLGAGFAMVVILIGRKLLKKPVTEQRITKKELPQTIAMIVLDIAAPILLMTGLTMTTAASASLLNNFEIVATALITASFFREKISPKLWAGIGFIVLACLILSFEGMESLQFTKGSLYILGASACWGLENNCTRILSSKDPLEIVVLKGLFSGTGSIIIGLITGERLVSFWPVLPAFLIGAVAYGLSIYYYVYAQRYIGAAKTSAWYAVSPFIGAILSLFIFREIPGWNFLIALGCMAVGTYLSR